MSEAPTIRFGPKTFLLGLFFFILAIASHQFMFLVWRPLEPLVAPFYLIGACLIVISLFYGEQIDEYLTWENLRWPYAFFVAFIADALDVLILAVFGLPVVGDAADLITMGLLFPVIGKYVVVGAIEFVPLIDLLPTHTASVFLAYFKVFGDPFEWGTK